MLNVKLSVLTPANEEKEPNILEYSFVEYCHEHDINHDSFTESPAEYTQEEIVENYCYCIA